MLPGLISAGASLLGGILSRNAAKKDAQRQEAFQRQQIAEMNEYNDPKNIRSRAEAAGFNPLLFIGPGVGQQTALASAVSSGNYLGSAVADAGMAIADQMAKNKELALLEKLSAQNKKLAEKVQALTIRPKVGGVYAQRQTTRSIGGETGNVSVSAMASATGVSGGRASARADIPEPIAKNTFEEYGNDGESTFVPVGPDLDEVFTGAIIATNNKIKKWSNILAPDVYQGPGISLDRVPALTWRQKEKLARQKATRNALKTPTFTLPYYGGGF